MYMNDARHLWKSFGNHFGAVCLNISNIYKVMSECFCLKYYYCLLVISSIPLPEPSLKSTSSCNHQIINYWYGLLHFHSSHRFLRNGPVWFFLNCLYFSIVTHTHTQQAPVLFLLYTFGLLILNYLFYNCLQ